MNIQKIKNTNFETLEENIVNIPCANGEKIFCTEPYAVEALNKYRASFGESVLENISEFETAKSDKLVNNAVVERVDEKYKVSINKKYDYEIPVKSESSEIEGMFGVGEKYQMPIAVSKTNGISISLGNSIRLSVKNELIQAAIAKSASSAYPAQIKECIKGGYMVSIQGVQCFMPGSTASLYKLKDYESIVGSSMMVIPISYNRERDKIVVSHVAFLDAIKPVIISNIMENERDNEFTGVVTLKKHDYILLTFNECLTGKLSFSDMDDETKEMFKNDKLVLEETELKFHIDYESDGLLTLTQTYYTKKLWDEKVKTEFTPKAKMDGVVVGCTAYNCIVQLKYNVIGTLQRGNNSFGIGDKVCVKIANVDFDKRKIKLAL